ncbi:hypothetical protein N7513_000278 [Penicillium frequentans]|nr:hypothetical protein N7513_000278 [Penicillium glabrum]
MPTSTTISAIMNARVFEGERFSDPATVNIDGELIGSSDVIASRTFDAKGTFLLPGLIDSHIHMMGPDDLATMAQYGVTTALDMATWPIERLNSFRNQKGVTNIRACGIPACGPGSAHSKIPSMPAEAVVASPAEGKQFVLSRIAEGADYIKVIADLPGLSQETMDVIVAIALQHEKLVVAHAATTIATRMAQSAGVDIVTHTPVDGVMTRDEIAQMVDSQRVSVPTLVMMKGACERRGAEYGNCRKTVAALHEAGVLVLAGTDANRAPGVPMQVAHGVSLHEELELLVECGLSTAEVLRSATSLPARVFGLKDRGRIESGLRADLVLVADNPLENITATRKILKVWVGGEEYTLPEK